MKTTFKMMGLADYITIFNGLMGTLAIVFIILAVDDMSEPWYKGGLLTDYIWAAMLCSLISIFGDIIDGPIARHYSKRQILGGSLDIMSDCISFCVAPALLIFAMFGRMGEATPIWTFSLAIACFWIIATGMLRLSRFQYDEGSNKQYFHGLASPGNALLLISAAGFIWLQPSSGFGPDLSSWNCGSCWGAGKDKPYFDFILLPLMFFSGAMMISDRKLSKLKKGLPMRFSTLQFAAILYGIIHAMTLTSRTDAGEDLSGTGFTMFLFAFAFVLTMIYIIAGSRLIPDEEE